MTDEEAIDAALTAVEARPGDFSLVRRNGRVLLALPAGRGAALRALRLYQPQRRKARLVVWLLRAIALGGVGRFCLPPFRHHGGVVRLVPALKPCQPGTAGVMLGSPEHRVRRAILSYRTPSGWEVAKLAFGDAGTAVIESEAAALASLPGGLPGVPKLLGVHHGEEFSILRLPYLQGKPLPPGEVAAALALLRSWVGDGPAMPATSFPEWDAMAKVLGESAGGGRFLDQLSGLRLRPVIRHGDFARWNLLRQRDGSLMVLDWEWGQTNGMPGLDLVHYFLQDHRLVRGLPHRAAVQAALTDLSRPACADYLHQSGWRGTPILPIIACLAWKQGAGHQENSVVIDAALAGGSG